MNGFRGIILAIVLAGGSSQAAVINIDFQVSGAQYVGLGIAFDLASNTHWNVVGPNPSASLLESDGTTNSGITVTNTLTSSFLNSGNALLADRIISAVSGLAYQISLAGFTPNREMDLYFYNGFYAQEYSVSGVGTATTQPDINSASLNVGSWVEGEEYGVIQNVVADGSGNVTINVNPQTSFGGLGTFGTIAGMQIATGAVVPEPSSAVLLGGALLALVRRRQQRL